jgi:outer membrane lipoprotein LolB
MKWRLQAAGRLVAAALVLGLAACAQAPVRPPATAAAAQSWSGRLALQVDDPRAQSFAAGFELTGDAQSGEMKLTNPLGGTLAVLAWSPGSATLRSGNDTRQFASLDALAAQVTGTPIPVAALFDWLRGINTPVPGWQADLSQLAQGRLRAQRSDPLPAADLRLAFDH